MSDTPKFTVVDRRKFRGDEEAASTADSPESAPTPIAEKSAPSAPPRLTLVEPVQKEEPAEASVAVADEPEESLTDPELPPAPSTEETRFQKLAYDQAADRLDDLIRAQNPGAPPSEKIGFEHLVQQLYLSAMMQMGAGTPEGQRASTSSAPGKPSICCRSSLKRPPAISRPWSNGPWIPSCTSCG